jgi:cytidylate kinase
MPPERLQKVLAEAGVASRRGSEALIAAGRVTVDGRVAALGDRADPDRDVIAVDGRPMETDGRGRRSYLALHKPAGVTSTVRDRHAERTVLDLVPRDLLSHAGRLYPVGRLDRDSEGLLLLSNDGPWTERVLHPSHGIEREYAIGLAGPLTNEQWRALRAGITLDEGLAVAQHLRPMTAVETSSLASLLVPPPRPLAWYRASLRQGWRRQLRRMFAAVGCPIERLVRVRVGTVRIDGLRSGGLRELSLHEARMLAGSGGGGTPAARERGGRPGGDGRSEGEPTTREVRRARAAANRPVEEVASGAPGRPGTGILGTMEDAGHGPDTVAPTRSRGLVVALDGPGSSGKSTVGALAARELGYRFCDTGLLYRAVTWLALERGVDPSDEPALVSLVDEVELAPDPAGRLDRVVVDGLDVSGRVRTAGIDERVSEVARVAPVRAALLGRQRALATGGGIIMAGRDIGTVVLPDADVKLYLDASAEERARRRAEERGLAPDAPEAQRILADLRRRDAIDSTRPVAPLRVAPDALRLVTDGLALRQTVDLVVAAVRARERVP